MSKEKQIDEIAKLICTYPQCIHHNIIGECANIECQIVDIAENLYKQGYRKQSEIIRCKDCKHFYENGNLKLCRYWIGHSTKNNAFCSYAKMKGGAE